MDVTDISVLHAKLATLKSIFRPSSPTDDVNLFRGRTRQIESLLTGIAEIGQHPVIYGERGVGKTSLSYIARTLYMSMHAGEALSVRVQCSDSESFSEVWTHFFRSFRSEVEALDKEQREHMKDVVERVETLLMFPDNDELAVHDVVEALSLIASRKNLLVILDEFDRLGGYRETIPFADLVKSVSDDLVPMTLIIVGVADNIDGLIQGHQSIARNIRQVAMPRMSDPELAEILTGGFAAYSEKTGESLSCDARTAASVARISQGFPYYTHLLGGAAGAEAIRDGETVVSQATVFRAMVRAVEDTSHAIRSSYTEAVSARADAQLVPTLLACALAETDDIGYFSSTDVANKLSEIVKAPRQLGHVNSHLKRFAGDPIWILEERRRGERSIRYRFRDPLMKPFVLIKGLESGMMPESYA
ncbi:ATP-binding protein [Frigoribacterium sp. CFBP9030]|uniref:ATP-binding protein n=1 Tax=Frigoribacterium sp. CFBP9030 TaxID=3096537 RepID=UPI002A69F0A5|nr:ATP-binding protein [Frigoribacterium sp. CFBP9030]MDY0892990.1 ATP-binding protein [Frigoribacterium sp. CFBP9030]